MSSTPRTTTELDLSQYKKPFSVSQLIIGLFLSTYFLSVAIVELSLSIYVIQENRVDLYRDYLIFKKKAPIWAWWQLLTSFIVPFSIIDTVRGLLGIFTKKATFKRNVLDVLQAVHLFSIIYTIVRCVMPLESQLRDKPSRNIAEDLHFFQYFIFMLNILGWLIPLLRYQDWQSERPISSEKKKQ